MILEIGHSYKITLKINNATLTYTCKITDIDDMFVSFLDKYNKKFTYNKNLILSFEELNGGDSDGN